MNGWILGGWAPRTDVSVVIGSPPIYKPWMVIWKRSHNPILRGQQRSPWLLTTYPSPGMIRTKYHPFLEGLDATHLEIGSYVHTSNHLPCWDGLYQKPLKKRRLWVSSPLFFSECFMVPRWWFWDKFFVWAETYRRVRLDHLLNVLWKKQCKTKRGLKPPPSFFVDCFSILQQTIWNRNSLVLRFYLGRLWVSEYFFWKTGDSQENWPLRSWWLRICLQIRHCHWVFDQCLQHSPCFHGDQGQYKWHHILKSMWKSQKYVDLLSLNVSKRPPPGIKQFWRPQRMNMSIVLAQTRKEPHLVPRGCKKEK